MKRNSLFRLIMPALLALLLTAPFTVITALASEPDISLLDTSTPETTPPEMGIWNPALSSDAKLRFAEPEGYLPEPKDGNFERWIDRNLYPTYAYNFYNLLVEGSNNNGYQDFLIDWSNSSQVETISFTENGQSVSATAVKLTTLSSVGSSYDEAYALINESFYHAYYKLRSAFECFDRDHPEVFWLSGSYYVVIPTYHYSANWNAGKNAYDYSYTGDVYFVLQSPSFHVKYEKYRSTDAVRSMIQTINTQVQTIVSGTSGMDEAQMIDYFNNWLTKHNEYNHRIGLNHEPIEAVKNSYPDACECTAALIGLTGNYGPVCESYARAMDILCSYVGIPCVVVDGFARNSLTAAGENHMWNYVKVEGNWYAVDSTWNDPITSTHAAASGSENENYLLIGGDTYCQVGGGTMRFLDSHPVRNRHFSNSAGYVNGPVLSSDRYVRTMESLSLTATADSVAYGYTQNPIFTANAPVASGQTGTVIYNWYIVTPSGKTYYVVDSNDNRLTAPTMGFPNGLEPGTHTVRVEAHLGNNVKIKEMSIKVIRTSFADVQEDSYYYTPVVWAVLNGITTGYQNDLFAPKMDCTRGQVVTFLWRANGCPEPKAIYNPFVDVKPSSYYYKAVLWAVENGITAGYYDNYFAPDITVTRGQVATFLYRFAGTPAHSSYNPFSDIAEGKYYHDAVLWAVENGITSGYYDDLFAPNNGCTRSQVVTFLYRMAK